MLLSTFYLAVHRYASRLLVVPTYLVRNVPKPTAHTYSRRQYSIER